MAIKAGKLTVTALGALAVVLGGTAVRAGEGQLDIVAWPGYIERGDTDPHYNWVGAFEKDTGCKVNVKTAATSDEMVSLMSQGSYDLVTASGDASLRLIAGKRVQAIDTSKLRDWNKLDPRLKNAPWYVVGGQTFGVPYQWGPNVLMYNTEVFKTAPTSWSVVFEPQNLPDGKPNKGRVQAYDGAIYIADAALYLKAKRPELGIKDPYELNPTQYAAVLELLRKQRPLVHRYWHDYNVQMSDFKSEGVAASGSWPVQVNMLKADKRPIASTIPAEGVTGWADTTMMHANAKHPQCAYAWLNWSLNDKVQAGVAEWFGSNPVTTSACSTRAPGGGKFCETNGFDNFDKIAFWKTPQAQCASQGTCVPYSRWTADYIAIMGGR
ncbi:ABC transporter substrate-binding protein [Niveibacterium umoris]|uniref:Putative spermidine/putrescine transport system substrate-binding protein n=1 Tax=Niveibacterium umoris TaxID=1193620 RepID=A0A840BIQ5_9RHOO|nr:ABC transporter substrate-binding protein [Niveibacterium umoris]MBB4013105.1 putative spermidine/putrescine transport system substrate-binding protein [Niveibacterium umoris]